jgi:hypothetical protein
MRFITIVLALCGLASCGAMMARSDAPEESAAWRRRQVQRDVEAIAQGMSHARAQSEAVARARARAP